MRRILMTALTAATLTGTAAHAYTIIGHWDQNSVGIHASATSFPAGSSFRTAIGDTVARFNQNPSEFRWNIHYDDSSVSRNNFESEIWFTNNWEWGDHSAVTLFRWGAGGRIRAADILFNNNLDHPWSTSNVATNLHAYGGNGHSFRTTLMHELGHGAGLGHENDEYNIMGEDNTHLHRWRNLVRAYLGEDASDGLIAIYGSKSGAAIEDLSVAHFKWVGRDGEYSDHSRCLIYNTNGTELSFDAFSGMRRYRVNKGQQVRLEFTYENNGETAQNGVAVGFYLSSNDLVTTDDRLLATATFNLTRGDVTTRTDTVTIPNDLTSGQTYYLGVILDRTGQITEVDEDNNRAYHIIKIN